MIAPIYLPNLLLVSGTGRKSGKTTLACSVISEISKNQKVIAVKISSHTHKGVGEGEIQKGENFSIWQETVADQGKDTARMLMAGASEVYYIECADDGLLQAFLWLLQKIKPGQPIICESGKLRLLFRPAVFFIATHPDNEPKPSSVEFFPLADKIWELPEILNNFNPQSVSYENMQWNFR